jgi:serine/threonine-protein kinase
MGTAFLARTTGAAGFERLVVVKRLHPHLTEDQSAVLRFLDEARIAASIYHANVVSTHYAGKDESGSLLVFDYIEGATLEELGDRSALRRQNFPVPVLLRIALDVLAGLAAVHDARDSLGRPLHVLHRDVSLQNILVGRDGVARLADFGIAKSAFRSAATEDGTLVGKLVYLPREYLARQKVGPTLDVYSLGVTVWQALAGTALWADASEAQLVHQIMHDRVPRLSDRMAIDADLSSVVETATAPNAQERFQSAAAMASALETVARKSGQLARQEEVAQFVGSLMDADLQRRRQRIQAAKDARPNRVGDSATEGGIGSASASVSSVDAAASARRRSRRWLAVLALGFFIPASVLAMRYLTKPIQQTAPAASIAAPHATLPSVDVAPAAVVPQSPASIPDLPETSAASQPAASSSSAPRTAAPKRRPLAMPASATVERHAGPLRAPDQIGGSNPYRPAP